MLQDLHIFFFRAMVQGWERDGLPNMSRLRWLVGRVSHVSRFEGVVRHVMYIPWLYNGGLWLRLAQGPYGMVHVQKLEVVARLRDSCAAIALDFRFQLSLHHNEPIDPRYFAVRTGSMGIRDSGLD